MTIEATPRTNAFAAFQQKLVSAGIRVGSPTMTGLQLAVQQYAATVADEAVAGATLCLTEHDIAHAISQWADEETAQGQMVRAMQLRQAAATVLNAAGQVDEERAKAVLRLPPAAPELPKWIRDRVDSVLGLVYGDKADRAPIHRLFATVVHEMVRAATGQAPSDVNAPRDQAASLAHPVKDWNLAEWIAAYTLALVREDGRSVHQAQADAVRITREAMEADGFAMTGTLGDMAKARGCGSCTELTDYLSLLSLGDLPRQWWTAYAPPEAPQMVPQQAQQPQARDVRGADGSWMGDPDRPHVRDIHPREGLPATDDTGKPLVMSHLVASARVSPAHAVAAAMEALRNAGAHELARTVEARLATVAALQPRTAAEARQIREGGPIWETHNFPGTPGGPPRAASGGLGDTPGRPDLVSTMLTGGIHPPTWDQAVTACATYLEGCGAREGKDLAVEIRTRVHMPKAG